MAKKETIIAASILLLAGIFYRFFPHPSNFAPVAAISLFSGFFFRRYFMALPLVIMLVSDIFIGLYEWKLMAVVYFSFIVIIFLGMSLRNNKSTMSIIGYSLAGSFLFFILTNFAVWLFSSWYVHSYGGLLNCYAMAIPFFKNTLTGDLFYTAMIFGCYEILAQPKERLRFLLANPKNNLA